MSMENIPPETPDQESPWIGEPTQIYPDDELRGELRSRITSSLAQHSGNLGIVASELAHEVAEELYHDNNEVVATSGDVTLEVSRMLGSSIRMAPNRRLYPKGESYRNVVSVPGGTLGES